MADDSVDDEEGEVRQLAEHGLQRRVELLQASQRHGLAGEGGGGVQRRVAELVLPVLRGNLNH